MDGQFVTVPGGAFLMGSDTGQDDERPVHEVHVGGFVMGVFPVTRREYARFIEITGHPPGRDWDAPELTEDDLPVVGVSWEDAVAYCDWRGGRGGSRALSPKAERGGG